MTQELYIAERLPHSIDPTKVKLLNDYLLVKVESTGERRYGMIVVPEAWKEKSKSGIVVAMAARDEAYEFAVGDRVYVEAFTGVEFEGYFIVKDTDVVAYEHQSNEA